MAHLLERSVSRLAVNLVREALELRNMVVSLALKVVGGNVCTSRYHKLTQERQPEGQVIPEEFDLQPQTIRLTTTFPALMYNGREM
jgi:hypothetical protein